MWTARVRLLCPDDDILTDVRERVPACADTRIFPSFLLLLLLLLLLRLLLSEHTLVLAFPLYYSHLALYLARGDGEHSRNT